MGSGKSSVGTHLAQQLSYDFVDLDRFIEQQENSSISQLFEQRGEVAFRLLEAKAVRKLCQHASDLVLAVGGGTPCYSNTMNFLLNQPHVKTVFLHTSIPVLTQRLKSEKHQRPLIAHLANDDLPEFFGKHLFERNQFYNQSEFKVLTDNMEVGQIASIINDLLF